MMRMARDAQPILASNFLQNISGLVVRTDELLDTQRDDVRIVPGTKVVLRDLGAGDNQQPVVAARPIRASRSFLQRM